ncbi:MAG: right-handed parallel beta-helix repeat-containing protein, partial [Candidatus Bathyarchaeota archaeon]
MSTKRVYLMVLVMLLMGVFGVSINVHTVEAASETISIRPDGSVDPDTAPISTVDNVTYTFTSNIVYDEIVVEKNHTVVDGAGYSIQGAWTLRRGISLYGVSNVTITNMEIRAFEFGVVLNSESSNNTISGNTITENAIGILLAFSSDNMINGNNITINYGAGIELDFSSNNTISGNTITNNDSGIFFYASSFDNAIYHNNVIGNNQQVHILPSEQANFWDDGYPSGGNYWSDYNGTDLYSGPDQNVPGRDFRGDTPRVIDANNTDRYPLTIPYETEPPTVAILSPENQTYAVDTVAVTFTVDEATVWMGYSLDGHATVTTSGNTTLPGLSDGSHYVVVYANDTFNNMGSSSMVYFTVDTTAPSISIMSPENKTYDTTDLPLNFTVNEPVSWMAYSL